MNDNGRSETVSAADGISVLFVVALALVVLALGLYATFAFIDAEAATQRTSSHVVTCHTKPHAIEKGSADAASTRFPILKTSPEQWVVNAGVFSVSATRQYMFVCTEEAPQ